MPEPTRMRDGGSGVALRTALTQIYREALERAPDNQRLYYDVAGTYEETGKYDDAIQVSQISLQKCPTATGYTDLSNAYF